MLGIIMLSSIYAMNKSPANIPAQIDTDITFPLNNKN